MKTDILFSVVIPTYNRAYLIEKTICSLLEQIYFRFELIVVDDGSTDNTTEIIQPYLLDDRVRYYKRQNSERGATRNFGASVSHGEFVNFFDSDDLAYPNHLLEAYRFIQLKNFPEVFHLGYDMRNPDGNAWKTIDNLPHTINKDLINGNHLSCNGVFIRKDIAALHPFSENRSLSASEDYALWLQLAARYPIYCQNVITSTIINHEQRSVLNINLEKFLIRMQLLQDTLLYDKQVQSRYKEEWPTFIASRDLYIALHLGMAKYPRVLSLKYLWMAVILTPRVVMTRRFLGALKNILL